jgi:hypothetical protein
MGAAPPETTRPRPWRDRLSSGLLDELQECNDSSEALLGGRRSAPATRHEMDVFYARAAELARRVQQELGPDYEVLHITAHGAWRWARPPSRHRQRQPS